MRQSIASELPRFSRDIEVLRGICHAFASARDLEEATRSAVRWAQAAVGEEDSGVRVFLPDPTGKLQLAAGAEDSLTDRADARRKVFNSRTPLRLELADSSGTAIGILPFMCRGDALGVLEVEAPDSVLRDSWENLEAVASQGAIALSNINRRSAEGPAAEQLDLGLAVTAHELRTPLLGAKAAVEHLAEKKGASSNDSQILRRVGRELDQLAQLVDLLLSWTVGSGTLDLRPTDLVGVVQEAIFSCGHQGAGRIRLSAPARLVIKADPRHIRGAVSNVIGNALVYSPESREVEIEVAGRDRWATVSVCDHGSGVEPTEVESIFDPFTRGSAAGDGRRPGAGLGLFIARRVIEAHGGDISVESNGFGSTFEIRLPIEEESP